MFCLPFEVPILTYDLMSVILSYFAALFAFKVCHISSCILVVFSEQVGIETQLHILPTTNLVNHFLFIGN